MKLSACIIARDEEENIKRAIDSLKFADEVIVVDSGSRDRTVEIAESAGARCVYNEWPGFSKQKQFATDLCTHEWVFSLDADEYVSSELNEEIESLRPLLGDILKRGFKVPRLTNYLGKPIRYSGWYPDHQLRLFRKDSGKWNQREIHESFELENPDLLGYLDHDILHDSVESLVEHKRMIETRYGPLGAQQMSREKKTVSTISLLLEPPLVFLKTLILRLGLLDGYRGILISYFAAYNVFLKKQIRYQQLNGETDEKTVE